MPRLHPSATPPPAELRRFALILASIVAVLFGLVIPLASGGGWPRWPWLAAAGLAAWGLLAPATVAGFHRLWMRFGALMNWLSTRLILGIVFYLVVLPTGLVLRLRGRDPLNRAWRGDADTYRLPSRRRAATDMRKPY